jgi:hypothetical protein
MKKYILSIILLVSVSAISAQSFDGVPISGDLPTAIAKYKAKGYVLSKYIEQGAIIKGRVAGRDIELFVFVTPKTKKVCKVVAFFDEETSWYSLKSTYNTFYDILTEKYGYPDDRYSKFLDPYYEGDGYEMSAVGLDKTLFAAYWYKKDNLTVAVEISKYKQVKLVYENNIMMDIKSKEQSEIESKVF